MKVLLLRFGTCFFLASALLSWSGSASEHAIFGGDLQIDELDEIAICDRRDESGPTGICTSNKTAIADQTCRHFTMTVWAPAPMGQQNTVAIETTWNCGDYGYGVVGAFLQCQGFGIRDVVSEDECTETTTVTPPPAIEP